MIKKFFKKLVVKTVEGSTYNRVVKVLIRNTIVHEKSEKFRRDVVNAQRAFEFESTALKDVKPFNSYSDLDEATLSRVNVDHRTWIELGVMTGDSSRFIAKIAKKLGLEMVLHGFDSFDGLPEDWHNRALKGAFAIKEPVFSEPNIKIHKGLFDDTLPKFNLTFSEPLGFIHLDSDLYSSAKTTFDSFKDKIVPGTVILFDEYWNYPEFLEHEIKAFEEFLSESGLGFEYIGYYKDHMQLSVVIV